MRDLHARRYETVRAAHDAGMPIYLGTDAGGSLPHGLVADEVAELARAGLPTAEALAAGDLGGPRVARPARAGGGRARPTSSSTRPTRARTSRVLAAPRPSCCEARVARLSRPRCAPTGSASGSARSRRRRRSRRTALAVAASATGSAAGTRSTPRTCRPSPRSRRDHRTLLIHARHPEGDHDLVGKVNVTNVVRGRSLSAAMGYDAYDPYAGRGLFAEGLRLVVGAGRWPREPGGMGLHRLEANVQPGNSALRRAAAVAGLPARGQLAADAVAARRGRQASAGATTTRYAMTAEDWPAAALRTAAVHPAPWCWSTASGSGRTDLARALARELSLPLLSQDLVAPRPGRRGAVGDAGGVAGRWCR